MHDTGTERYIKKRLKSRRSQGKGIMLLMMMMIHTGLFGAIGIPHLEDGGI